MIGLIFLDHLIDYSCLDNEGSSCLEKISAYFIDNKLLDFCSFLSVSAHQAAFLKKLWVVLKIDG